MRIYFIVIDNTLIDNMFSLSDIARGVIIVGLESIPELELQRHTFCGSDSNYDSRKNGLASIPESDFLYTRLLMYCVFTTNVPKLLSVSFKESGTSKGPGRGRRWGRRARGWPSTRTPRGSIQ